MKNIESFRKGVDTDPKVLFYDEIFENEMNLLMQKIESSYE